VLALAGCYRVADVSVAQLPALSEPVPDKRPVVIRTRDGDPVEIQGYFESCPGTWNPLQIDSDNDGVGDDCDNCPGSKGDFPDQHLADRNNVVSMVCTTDAQCTAIHPEGVCVPGRILPTHSGGLTVDDAHCSKFADADSDEVGDACDNCPNTFNPGLSVLTRFEGSPRSKFAGRIASCRPPIARGACQRARCAQRRVLARPRRAQCRWRSPERGCG
jgi:hypothetical protein